MTVGAAKLIHMAEQIAANVTVSQDPEVIASAVANHLLKFWDPRMRNELVEHARKSPDDLSELLHMTVKRLAFGPTASARDG